MSNQNENDNYVNGILSLELQEGLKDIKPTTEDFEELDFVTYKYYNQDVKHIMDLFRTVLKDQIYNEYTLKLSEEVICEIPGCFTAYYYRRRYFDKIGINQDMIEYEIQFMEELLPGNPKCFQIWEHRKYLVTHNNHNPQPWKKEIQSICKILEGDNKNYHAWAYRIWVCDKFDLHEVEIPQIEWMIDVDVGNNSAWCYRRFLKNKLLELGKINNFEDLVDQEILYVKKKLTEWPENEAAWNYLLGFFQLYQIKSIPSKPQKGTTTFDKFPQILELCEENLKLEPHNRYALSTKVYALLQMDGQENRLTAKQSLIEHHDKIRQVYWRWFLKNLNFNDLSN